ncbi:Protein of unknown function [Gryllus bimaculatus]|nr:Protein of unknown function [Gryllus bimaculatus]
MVFCVLVGMGDGFAVCFRIPADSMCIRDVVVVAVFQCVFCSSVGSLTIGVTFLLSPLAGVLVDRFGIRPTTFVGGLLAASGMFLSSLFVDSVSACLPSWANVPGGSPLPILWFIN